MALHNVQSKEMRLVLSSDAKPRLKWTSELHQRFIDAVDQLGGPEKATPKSLMRVMGIHGLTLYHLKSHLQKYRMGRSQESHQNKQEDYREKHFISKASDGAKEQINENLQITQALQMQMEVQRKLHEQIEVQRHMQQRIETQGKYIQSVLKKAQETLSEYGSCSIEAEQVKAQLSELVSMVDSGCPSSSLSSLTSSESSWRMDESQPHENYKQEKRKKFELQLMQMHPPVQKNQSESQDHKRFRLMETIDLNCKSLNDYDSGPRMIDLNI